MPFEPDKITREHIEKAVQKIKEEEIDLNSSIGYDVIIDGEAFPPKEIMRYAHEEMNGEKIWERSDGDSTNNYLKNLGFEIKEKSKNYTWVQTHKELVEKLKEFQDRQTELIDLLEESGVEDYTLIDEDKDGKRVRLSEIDPYTFFCFIYKYGNKKRLQILQRVAKHFEVSQPTDTDGIPSAHALKVMMFPFVSDGRTNEVNQLWDLFEKELKDKINNEDFERITSIKSVGATKFTEALFNIDPESYLPINAQTKPYLKQVMDIDPSFASFDDYLKILEEVRKKSKKPFCQISHEAWEWNTGRSDVNYWVFQGNPDYYDLIEALKNDAVKSWTINSHKDKIQPKDKVILWKTGEKSGCYALLEVEQKPMESEDDEEKLKYYHQEPEGDSRLRAKVQVTHNLAEIPIFKYEIRNIDGLEDLNVGLQGTNFKATKEEYELIKHIAEQKLGSEKSAYNNTNAMKDSTKDETTSLNQILFGPPGTGKTYNTVNKALQIVDPEFYEANKGNREALTKRYRELLINDWENHKSGQIAMTTFHQSFTYEDFIEGIKPLLIDKNNDNGQDSEPSSEIGYEIQNGIFKNISELARQESGGKVGQAKGQIKWDRDQFNKAEFYKLSLGNVNIAEDDEIYQYCINNDRISIGFLWDEDLTNVEESEINQLHIENSDYDKHDCTSMAIFRHHLKEGYYVVIANGNHKFRAIGKVIGDYFYDKDSPIRYPHFRKVEWIAKDLDLSVDLIYNKNFSQKTIYHLRKKDVKPEFFVRSKATTVSSSDKKPFVLIIDEINRGNIAQIFGELITLIEEDKREGMDEEMSVSLPYSKQPFSVPSNLHIIGTMNTADRSIEALDTALRRRFTFEEVPPKPEIIEQDGKTNIVKVAGKDIELTDIIETINKRVEKLLDKDHMIGHSYFMKVSDVTDLRKTFQKNIIPLLEEYFYGDKGKIQMILGKGFIEKSDISYDNVFAESDYEGVSLMDEKEVWTMSNAWKDNDEKFNEALQTLLS